MMEMADTNNDGKISFQEFKNIIVCTNHTEIIGSSDKRQDNRKEKFWTNFCKENYYLRDPDISRK